MAPTMKGYLLKKGTTTKARYFVLEGSVLAYYGSEDELGGVPRGQLPLGPDSRIVELPGKKGLTVIAQRKTWTLGSDSGDVDEVTRWYEALQSVVSGFRGSAVGSAGDTAEQRVVTVSGTDFVLDRRYDGIRPLGHGAYGVVVSAVDRQLQGLKVAIKKCPNIFEDPLDAKRIAREIRLLRHFNHPNIIKVTDIVAPPSADFSDVYIVAELMDTDLHRVIYSGQKLTEEHIQFFLYQMLCGVKYIHSANVIHRDLKPSNILLNENCDLKICDFGLARDMTSDGGAELPGNLTEYVVTRWYRAPEIMLSSQEYTKAVDVWALGCIFGEMMGRKPMFPGNDYIHQLKLITKALGSPTEEQLHFVKNPKAKVFMLQLPYCPPTDFSRKFPDASPAAIDLLGRMLQLDFQKRVTVEEALEHPYFASVRDPSMEFVTDSPVPWGAIETCELSRGSLQMRILEDVVHFHPWCSQYLDEHRARGGEAAAGTTMDMA